MKLWLEFQPAEHGGFLIQGLSGPSRSGNNCIFIIQKRYSQGVESFTDSKYFYLETAVPADTLSGLPTFSAEIVPLTLACHHYFSLLGVITERACFGE